MWVYSGRDRLSGNALAAILVTAVSKGRACCDSFKSKRKLVLSASSSVVEQGLIIHERVLVLVFTGSLTVADAT